jgi:hypothetical protein
LRDPSRWSRALRSGPTIALAAALLATSTLRAQSVTVPLEDVDGRIGFQIAEQLDSTGGASPLRIEYWSEKQFSGPTGLRAKVTKRENSFILGDWRLVFPTGLVPGVAGRAYGSDMLPIRTGVYELVIRRSGVDDRYRLALNRELIHVTPIGVPRVSLTSDTLIRRAIPNSFLVVCNNPSWVCARVFRELSLVPGLRPFAIPPVGRSPFGNRRTRNEGRGDPPRYFRYAKMWQVDSARAAIRRARGDKAGSEAIDDTGLVLWLNPNVWWWPETTDPSDPQSRVER